MIIIKCFLICILQIIHNEPITYDNYSSSLSVIEQGICSNKETHIFFCLAIDVALNNNIEGSEWIGELMDDVIIANPKAFICEYSKLSSARRKVVNQYLESMSEDADLQSLYNRIKQVKTLRFLSKQRIKNSIKKQIVE